MPDRKRDHTPEVIVHDLGWSERTFLEAALDGLSRPQKSLPCQFLYDKRGSELFERISALPEYYLTRMETLILRAHAGEIGACIGPGAVLYELGSGSSHKTPLLLDQLPALGAYVPIDVSREHLTVAAAAIAAAYPALRVEAVCGDYNAPQLLPQIVASGRQAAFFPGSTIGNLTRREAIALLKLWRARLGGGGVMVVGVDTKKDERALLAAYDDASGVTAQFILNILVHANREIGSDFKVENFAYEARYDRDCGAMRMYLVSRADHEVTVAGRTFYIARDERLHIEDSHKYTPDEFAEVAACAGFNVRACYTDPKRLFSVQVLTASG